MVAEGRVHLREYERLKRAANLYALNTAHFVDNPKLTNLWIHGKTGVGKSKGVRRIYGASLHNKNINKWWDGYQHEKTVLFDDFGREHKVLGHFLKQWADHYPFTAEVKGGSM